MTYSAPSHKSLVLTAVVALLASVGLFVSRPVDVMVDGTRMESDVPPVTTAANHVFVPVRSIADALGAQTLVVGKGDRIVVTRGSDTLQLRVGDVHATLDGMPMTLDRGPFRVRGRVMVGLQTIARAFGVRVTYDAAEGRIEVMTPGIGQVPPTSNVTEATQ
ncbi:MAG TPA: copper amine oxidase N-terminal domain-containing protein [Candidatus Tyrphobacter sp.]